MPKLYFISHSYKDEEVRQGLLGYLPRDIEPFVFPPIKVPPDQLVSDRLLDAIRACDGLIYLKGGASAESFWVALERDYALRQGKPVFAFDPTTRSIAPDMSVPLALRVFVCPAGADSDIARRVVVTLRARFFDARSDQTYSNGGNTALEGVKFGLDQALRDGYVVVLWSSHAVQSRWLLEELGHAEKQATSRLVFAHIEPDAPRHEDSLGPFHPVLLRDIPDVQLFGDMARSFEQRIDDLIVRLYWYIYGRTRQNQLS